MNNNLYFSEEDIYFRFSIRRFINENLPSELRERIRAGYAPTPQDIRMWQRLLSTHGFAAPTWSKEDGGPGWTPTQQFIFMDEIFRAPAPEPFNVHCNVVGPVIAKFGSPEQRNFFLPKLLNMDIWFCIGMSEPEAGSDLASLRTTARRVDDEFVINGEKIWTSTAAHADWILLFARTDTSAPRPQDGISVLLVNLQCPGITVRPIRSLDHREHFCAVHFDNVRVPADSLLGLENKGWSYAKAGLGDERLGIARVGLAAERIEYAAVLAAQISRDDTCLVETPSIQRRLAVLDVEKTILEIMQLKCLDASMNDPGAITMASSILKILGSELWQQGCELVLDISGHHALHDSDGRHRAADVSVDGWAAGFMDAYFYSRAATIYGGTTEIQKNILAKTLLGQ